MTMKKSNNIISDWLDKYGDPEIDKRVEKELELINNKFMNKLLFKMQNHEQTIHILAKNYQRCTKYTGFIYLYKNIDNNQVGSFSERLLEFYQSKFNVIFKIQTNE